MRRYSAQPRDQIFVKGYGLLFFANNMGKTIGKNISKNWSGKCSQNFLIMLNNQKQMRLKWFQNEQLKQQQKQLEISLVIKLLIKITNVSIYSHKKNISKTVTNENNKEIPKENISLQKKDRKLLIN